MHYACVYLQNSEVSLPAESS